MTPIGSGAYKRTSIKTADRRQVIGLLYEGIIKNLHGVIGAIESSDGQTRSAKLGKSLEIIRFLSTSLDFEKGGEIAKNLSALYDYSRDTITQADITGDTDKFREVIDLVNVLLDGWSQISETRATAVTPVPDTVVKVSQDSLRQLAAAPSALPRTTATPAMVMVG